MLGDVAFYKGEFRRSRELLEELAIESRQLGNARAEMNSHHMLAYLDTVSGRPRDAFAHITRARELADKINARRFVMNNSCYFAMALRGTGERDLALEHLAEAEEVARELQITWVLPWVYGERALTEVDESKRRKALEEGERLLASRRGTYPFEFYLPAADTALEIGDWEAAERYAAALEDYVADEPIGLVMFVAERARALASVGRGQRDPAVMSQLQKLKNRAEDMGFATAVPAIERALAS